MRCSGASQQVMRTVPSHTAGTPHWPLFFDAYGVGLRPPETDGPTDPDPLTAPHMRWIFMRSLRTVRPCRGRSFVVGAAGDDLNGVGFDGVDDAVFGGDAA